MGDRGGLTDEPVDRAATIAAELVDALAMAVSSLGLCDRSGSSLDEPAPFPAITEPSGRLLFVVFSSPSSTTGAAEGAPATSRGSE